MSGPDSVESHLPTGTLTFLFTDVVGSTRLWQDHPAEMAAALARHDELVSGVIGATRGYVFSTAGDAFAAAFESAKDAVDAAVAVQQRLAIEPWARVAIEIRIGLHTGGAEERNGDYFGPVLNRAARIMSLAGAAQILLSAATHGLVLDDLPAGCTAADLGDQKLKSLDRPERLFQLLGRGLSNERVEFAAAGVRGNLPSGVVDFVGHTDDIARLAELAVPGGLITLTGIGGAGKTQLSQRVAASLAGAYPDGVWWCDLTPLAGPELVPGAVASALGFIPSPELEPIAAVADVLARRRILLVLDNCEHVLDAVAALLAALVAECPGVAVLATSREPIGLRNEIVWSVPPLDPASDAVELLVRRAAASDASLDPAAWDRDELEELCKRLDGIPLAIEMAAARLRSMSPRQLLERLDDRFKMLRSRRRDSSDRHQTLLTMLDWSYQLLEPDEQLLLDRLSVFADVFDLETVERICADDDLDTYDIADLLTALVDKSLVTAIRGGAGVRYRLLETIRHYGRTHLDERDVINDWRRRHAEQYAAIVTDAGLRYRDRRFWSAKSTFEDNWSDIVAALEWAVSVGDSGLAASLIRGCGDYALDRGRSEIGELARAALDLPGAEAIAYAMAAFFADGAEQIALTEAGLALPAHVEWDKHLLYSQLAAGRATTGAGGTFDAIRGAAEQADEIGSNLNQAYWEGIIAESTAERDRALARQHAERALELLDGWMDHPSASGALGRIAGCEALLGNFDESIALCDTATRLADDAGLVQWRAYAVTLSARIAAATDAADADVRLHDAIVLARDSRWWFNVWPVMSAAGRWFEQHGRVRPAAVIEGHFVQRGRSRSGFDLARPVGIDYSLHSEWLRAGAEMSIDELVDSVLDELGTAR
jgi:predicted ATPase/class 3 adenylate cyclase